jgi:phytoene desaturase
MARVVGVDYRSLFQFLSPSNLLLFLRLRALISHTGYASRFFHDPRLLTAFTFHDLYMGLSPYESPALYSFLQYTELAHGLWYPVGGMYHVAEVLVGIAGKLGVQFMYNAPVEKILVGNGRATGVALADGRTLPAEVVVANADLGYVYNSLLPDDGMAARINRKEYGCSAVTFYWGLDKQYPALGPHNLFLGGDYRRYFEILFKDLGMPDQPYFYIHAPAHVDPSLVPPGHDMLLAAVPVGHINSQDPQDWQAIRSKARAYILQRLAEAGLPDIEVHIKVEAGFLPTDWQGRYNLTLGSTHGLSHKLTQMGYLRPHRQHHRYPNLFFVGASTHPGTGIPTVLISARLTAERVLQG